MLNIPEIVCGVLLNYMGSSALQILPADVRDKGV